MKKGYEVYSKKQLEKIGNTIIYLVNTVNKLSKTKLLKLLYILDEESIKATGRPFLNLEYKIWEQGPVNTNLFFQFSNGLSTLSDFISVYDAKKGKYFKSKKEFSDDRFSDDDIDLLENIAAKFKDYTPRQTVDYTHQEKGLWETIAKQHNVLEELVSSRTQTTDFDIDFTLLIKEDDRKTSTFERYQLLFQ